MRGEGLLWLAVVALLALPGAPLLAHPGFARLSAVSRAILAGAAGAVLVSFVMTAFALFGLPWSLPAVLAAAVLLAFLLRPALRSDFPLAPGAPSRADRATRAANAVAAAGVAAALLATAAGAASSPDLIFFWGPKAQQFALARTVDARFLAEPYLSYMHAYYPPLVTNLYALCSMAAGRMSWTAATLLFPLILAALAVALPDTLRTASPAAPAPAAAASALAVCVIGLIGTQADIGGNGEMPLLFYETMAAAILISPLAAGAAGQLLAGLLLAGAICAKVEGLPFALSAAAAFLWMRRKSGSPVAASAVRLLAPAAVSLAAWFAFGASRRLFRGYSGDGRFLDFHPEFAGVVLGAVAKALLATGYGLPYLIPLVCLLIAARRLDERALVPLVAAAGLLAFCAFVYLDRPEDPTNWIAWSAARVLSPVAVLFTLAAACARGAPAPPGARRAGATSS
jgi:hypothetical protein